MMNRQGRRNRTIGTEEASANVAYLKRMLAHPNGIAKLPHPGTT